MNLKVGNSQIGNQHFVFPQLINSPRIPYELIIKLPKPRYERNIVKRDGLGRIVSIKVPA